MDSRTEANDILVMKFDFHKVHPKVSITVPLQEIYPKILAYLQDDPSLKEWVQGRSKGMSAVQVDKLGTKVVRGIRWFDKSKTLEEEGMKGGGAAVGSFGDDLGGFWRGWRV